MEQLSIDDDEWTKDEGLPVMADPFIQKYFQGRDALIAQEKKHRSDRAFRELLSPMAQEACAIVNQIRWEELDAVWKRDPNTPHSMEIGDIYPGMPFPLAKDRMEQTKLWKIVKKMPKGALLHCHLEATVNLEWLFNVALDTPGIHIRSPEPLSPTAHPDTQTFTIQYSKASNSPECSIWTDTYPTDRWVPLLAAAESFPGGGRKSFIDWLLSKCTISPTESLNQHHGINQIWRKFMSVFGIVRTFIYYEPIFRRYLVKLFETLVEDGIRYADIRIAFAFEYMKEGSDTPEDGFVEMFRVLDEEITKFKQTEQGKRFWGARIIWNSIRAFDSRPIMESMKQCITTKQLYPHLITGFDLVGQEDLGRSLAHLTPELFWFKKRCAEEGVDIPFFFHAGETHGSGDETDENLFDAILLGTRRIGHGFSLYKHPLLMNMVRDRKILVESCPISNEVLRLTGSILSHPLPAVLAQGVPAALCNDDPSILGHGTSGLTHDFWQALQAWESLGMEGLGSLAENSVRWAAFEDLPSREWTQDIKDGAYGNGLRAKYLKEWSREWEKYCQWIVIEYGADIDLDPEQ